MRVIVKQTLVLETLRHDFDNEFAYIEQWVNKSLKDCYFAEKGYIYPNGQIKSGGRKYFYAPFDGAIEKEVKQINCEKFKSFENLFYFDEEGDIYCIDGRAMD